MEPETLYSVKVDKVTETVVSHYFEVCADSEEQAVAMALSSGRTPTRVVTTNTVNEPRAVSVTPK